MRLQLIGGLVLQLTGIYTAVLYSNTVLALIFVYAGFIVIFHHKLKSLFRLNRNQADNHISTHYVVQCKGESGWFDLELQKYPRKDILRYPVYKMAKKQLDTILKTRDAVESDRLRIVKRTTREGVV